MHKWEGGRADGGWTEGWAESRRNRPLVVLGEPRHRGRVPCAAPRICDTRASSSLPPPPLPPGDQAGNSDGTSSARPGPTPTSPRR